MLESMWDKFCLLAKGDDEGPMDAIVKFLPILIILVLSALSRLLKRKEKQQKTSKPTRPASGTKPLPPPYARKTQAPKSAPAAPLRGRPAAPAAARPKPQRPSQPAPVSRQPSPRQVVVAGPIYRPAPAKARPVHAKPAQRKAAPPAHRPTHKVRTETPAQIAARKQMLSTGEAAELRRANVQSQPKARLTDTHDGLQLALERPGQLARAIVYAEILGKPMALRATGSFEF